MGTAHGADRDFGDWGWAGGVRLLRGAGAEGAENAEAYLCVFLCISASLW